MDQTPRPDESRDDNQDHQRDLDAESQLPDDVQRNVPGNTLRLVGANALVPNGKEVPSRAMALGDLGTLAGDLGRDALILDGPLTLAQLLLGRARSELEFLQPGLLLESLADHLAGLQKTCADVSEALAVQYFHSAPWVAWTDAGKHGAVVIEEGEI